MMIVIYRSSDSRWLEACAWAKENNIDRMMVNETCYRGLNHRADMFYAISEAIAADYAVAGIRRLTDEVIDGN